MTDPRNHPGVPMLTRISVVTATALTALAIAAFPAATAKADGPSGSVSATVTVAPPAIRSLTVSPSAISFGSCEDAAGAPSPAGLAIPHGTCRTPDGTGADAPITITNGDVASQIDVSGGDALPADNGQHWTLCGTGASCSAFGAPGADQFSLDLRAVGNTAVQPRLGTTPACDNVF